MHHTELTRQSIQTFSFTWHIHTREVAVISTIVGIFSSGCYIKGDTNSNSNLNSFIHVPITSFRSVKVYIYIYIFDDGYKGDPQKALLKAASMLATLRCGA